MKKTSIDKKLMNLSGFCEWAEKMIKLENSPKYKKLDNLYKRRDLLGKKIEDYIDKHFRIKFSMKNYKKYKSKRKES